MMIHISLGGVGAIHAEGAWAYGRNPAWKLSRFGREFVLDLPFLRVILTPGKLPNRRKAQNGVNAGQHLFNRMEWNGNETEKPFDADRAAAGIKEDRS